MSARSERGRLAHELEVARARSCEIEAALQRRSHDGMTAVLRIEVFREHLVDRLRRTRGGLCGALIVLQADRLADIHRDHGFAGGTALLSAVGAAMRAGTRAGDPIGRGGDDRFALLLRGRRGRGARVRLAPAGRCRDARRRSGARCLRVGRRVAVRPGDGIGVAASLHRRDAVDLNKPGPTPEERIVMTEHPVVGERILRSIGGFAGVADIVRHARESFDGSGYPTASSPTRSRSAWPATPATR